MRRFHGWFRVLPFPRRRPRHPPHVNTTAGIDMRHPEFPMPVRGMLGVARPIRDAYKDNACEGRALHPRQSAAFASNK